MFAIEARVNPEIYGDGSFQNITRYVVICNPADIRQIIFSTAPEKATTWSERVYAESVCEKVQNYHGQFLFNVVSVVNHERAISGFEQPAVVH